MYNLLKKHRRAFNAANNNFGAANIVSRQLKKNLCGKKPKEQISPFIRRYIPSL